MQYETHEAEAKMEETHWWFVGRRALFLRELLDAGVRPTDKVLDIGTSTGTNLRMLGDAAFQNVTGLDNSPVAARFCAEKGLGTVRIGDVCNMPFEPSTFDAVLATDIIEHVEDDRRALAEIHRVLKPGGIVLFSVPTFPALWGLQDEVSMHFRRYYRKSFVELVRAAGLTPRKSYYFNYLLFVPIWLGRQVIRLFGIKAKSENDLNNPVINRILQAIFTLDIHTAPVLKPPFGVSALCLAIKK